MPEAQHTCFFVSPIGTAGSKIRKRADDILRYIVRPACKNSGFAVIRADEIDEPGMITHRVIKQLLTAELVIADLSGHNPNVFYELGIRYATGRPVIQLCQEGDRLPFDISDVATIFFDYGELSSTAACQTRIETQIKSIRDKSRQENPVTLVLGANGKLLGSSPRDVDTIAEFKRFSQQILSELQGLQEIKQLLIRGVTSSQPVTVNSQGSSNGLSGLWTSNFGPMQLAQEGSLVFGKYKYAPVTNGDGDSKYQLGSEDTEWTGEITGKTEGDVVIFLWRWIDGSQNGVGYWQRGENELLGRWFYSNELPGDYHIENILENPGVMTSISVPPDRKWEATRTPLS